MSGKHWIIGLVIITSGFTLFSYIRDSDQERNETNWTETDVKTLVNTCIRDTGEQGKVFPELTKDYCECGMKNVTETITKSEYLKLLEKPMAEQQKVLMPLVQNCLHEYQSKISK